MTNSRDAPQADLVLARYSCIALRRIGGSAKKVKGTSCPEITPYAWLSGRR